MDPHLILSNPLLPIVIFWWGPAGLILVGLFFLAKKFIPYFISSYTARIDSQTQVLRELQKTMATKSERETIEHREMLIMLKTITSATLSNLKEEKE